MLKPLNRINGRQFYEHAIPVLCYHSTPARSSFKMQMEAIRECGWSVIGLEDLVGWIQERRTATLPAVVITFDDCYRDQLVNAAPVLKEYRYPATFFAVTQWVQRRFTGAGLTEVPKLPLMRREELRELRKLGFTVGCHTRTHRSLPQLKPAEQKIEIECGKRELENILREQVRFFCYPYGQQTPEAVKIAKECGFSAAVCTKVGAVQRDDDLFGLKRLCVPPSPSLEEFRAQLTWIPQVAEMVHRVPHLDSVARVLWGAG